MNTQHLQNRLIQERRILLFEQYYLAQARMGRPGWRNQRAFIAGFERRVCQALDRVWDAQEDLKCSRRHFA